MNDETPAGIQDVDFLGGVEAEVDGIEVVSSVELRDAAREVVAAAARARAREFHADVSTDQYSEVPGTYVDDETLDFWVPTNGGYRNSNTGETISYDPTQPNEEQYQWIPELFEYFHEREPNVARNMAIHCERTTDYLSSTEMAGINLVLDAVDKWAGVSQEHFKNHFLTPFLTTAVPNQQALFSEMGLAMYSYEAILRHGRVDAKTIADAAVNVLDSLHVGGGGGLDVSVALATAGVALAVVSTVATAGSTTALTLGLLGAGLNAARIVADSGSDSEETRSLNGAYVSEVLDQLKELLDTLSRTMDEEEEILAGYLRDTCTELEGVLRGPDVREVLPKEVYHDGTSNLTDGELPTPDEFRPPM